MCACNYKLSALCVHAIRVIDMSSTSNRDVSAHVIHDVSLHAVSSLILVSCPCRDAHRVFVFDFV